MNKYILRALVSRKEATGEAPSFSSLMCPHMQFISFSRGCHRLQDKVGPLRVVLSPPGCPKTLWDGASC